MRHFWTIALGKAAAAASRLFGRGGGTALPGLLAERLDPELLAYFVAQLPRGAVLVTGTNGKTTTARMLSEIFKAQGWRVMHNRTGSNLLRGILSTLIEASRGGRIHADIGLFEVDEFALGPISRLIAPAAILFNNLFRDQLDRYGELDAIVKLWKELLHNRPDAEAVVNGDDPAVASLSAAAGRWTAFGLEDPAVGLDALPHAADARFCPRCGTALQYATVFLSHLGRYRCESCGDIRPPLAVAGRQVTLGRESSHLVAETPAGPLEVEIRVPGLYNVYNALAAVSVALAAGCSLEAVRKGLTAFTAVFGRVEKVAAGDKWIRIFLVKNPVGFNEVIRTMTRTNGRDGGALPLLIVINDRIADGRDVSWLWDVDFEHLQGRLSWAGVSGIRAEDMALRLKYAGVTAPGGVGLEKDLERAITTGLDALPPGGTLYLTPTYTAMLEVRQVLGRLGWVGKYWEE